MLIIETKVPWGWDPENFYIAPGTDPQGYATFEDAQADLPGALRWAGFSPYGDVLIPTDELDPTRGPGPEGYEWTTDLGVELRVSPYVD